MIPPKYDISLPDSERNSQASIGKRIGRRVTNIAWEMQARTTPTVKDGFTVTG